MSKIAERNINKNVGAMIRTARKAKKYSLQELGRMVNVSASYISRIENGSRACPSVNLLRDIAIAVGLEPAELMGLEMPLYSFADIQEIAQNGQLALQGKPASDSERTLVIKLLDALEKKEWTRVNSAQFVVSMLEALQAVKNAS